MDGNRKNTVLLVWSLYHYILNFTWTVLQTQLFPAFLERYGELYGIGDRTAHIKLFYAKIFVCTEFCVKCIHCSSSFPPPQWLLAFADQCVKTERRHGGNRCRDDPVQGRDRQAYGKRKRTGQTHRATPGRTGKTVRVQFKISFLFW